MWATQCTSVWAVQSNGSIDFSVKVSCANPSGCFFRWNLNNLFHDQYPLKIGFDVYWRQGFEGNLQSLLSFTRLAEQFGNSGHDPGWFLIRKNPLSRYRKGRNMCVITVRATENLSIVHIQSNWVSGTWTIHACLRGARPLPLISSVKLTPAPGSLFHYK